VEEKLNLKELNELILDSSQSDIRKFKRFQRGEVFNKDFKLPKVGYYEFKNMRLNDQLLPTSGLSLYRLR